LYEGMTVAARYPWLAVPVARWTGHGVVLDERTDVVIEGYPCSANWFAVAAFRVAQARPIRVGHHTHAPAHVIAAVRREMPVLVLARRPDDAVADWVALKPDLSVRQALRAYVRFYEPLLPYRDRFVVGFFDDVHTDFGLVIRRMNGRFGTSFREFEHTAAALRKVSEMVERDRATRTGSGLPVVGRAQPPVTSDTEPWREAAGKDGWAGAPAALRARADELFRLLERA
jgi:hypothetical protein